MAAKKSTHPGQTHRNYYLRLFQNFSFGTATLNLVEKPGFDRFFQELVPKPTGFWNQLT
jgi:hypothetical protein